MVQDSRAPHRESENSLCVGAPLKERGLGVQAQSLTGEDVSVGERAEPFEVELAEIKILDLPGTNSMTLGRQLTSLSLSSLIFKTGIIGSL